MKKAFAMPKIVVEQFVPNEYVAACGDENKVYLFECDSGRDFMNIFGFSIDAWGDVFLDDVSLEDVEKALSVSVRVTDANSGFELLENILEK